MDEVPISQAGSTFVGVSTVSISCNNWMDDDQFIPEACSAEISTENPAIYEVPEEYSTLNLNNVAHTEEVINNYIENTDVPVTEFWENFLADDSQSITNDENFVERSDEFFNETQISSIGFSKEIHASTDESWNTTNQLEEKEELVTKIATTVESGNCLTVNDVSLENDDNSFVVKTRGEKFCIKSSLLIQQIVNPSHCVKIFCISCLN